MHITIKPDGKGKPMVPALSGGIEAVRGPLPIEGCLRRDQMAPAFEAEAYHRGKRVMVNSKDFANKWLVMFFYSSDFTFV